MTVACVPSAGHRPHLRSYQPNKMLLYHSWVGLPLYLAAVCPLQFGESSVIVAFEKLRLGQIVAAKQTNPFDLVIETQFLIDEPTMKLLCEILIFVWFRPNSSWFAAWTPMVRFFSDWTSWEKTLPSDHLPSFTLHTPSQCREAVRVQRVQRFWLPASAICRGP